MSKETMEWLNQNVLVGFTDKRGEAWHYRASDQGDEPNHYPGAIPVDDVRRRLFNWQAEEKELFFYPDPDSPPVQLPDRKAIVRSDNQHVMGVFKAGYVPHQYDEWLLNNVSNILDDTLQIGSAGLLKAGAQAWVQVEVPDSITTPEGVAFRPNLLAATSFDGSLATTYKRTITVAICDNTQAAALKEAGQEFKARHSKYSGLKIADAREALAIIHTAVADFEDKVKELCQWEVTDKQWQAFLEELAPVNDDDMSTRAQTANVAKRESLNTLYKYDERAATWQGTAFGVLQAHNTYLHHVVTRRATNGHGMVRAERNMEDVLMGKMQANDTDVIKALAKVTDYNLVKA